jgi:tRNA pseudouridine55 synthase
MQGIINIYKPRTFTSHDCVAIARRASGIKKTGHTGTLDPMASGVLPVCIGRATRIIQYLDNDTKEYICTMRLGIRTDTLDVWGNVTETNHSDGISERQITEVLKSFEGRIMQTPPKYSALKVNGRKLYEYAREGKDVEIKPREVMIHSIDRIRKQGDEISFRMVCGKGTYVRSVCDDAGLMLGCGAAMSGLVRSRNGIFDIRNAIDIRRVKEMGPDDVENLLIPMDKAVSFRKVEADRKQTKDLIDGKNPKACEGFRITGNLHDNENINDISENEKLRLYNSGSFIGICRYENGLIIPEKIFNTELR